MATTQTDPFTLIYAALWDQIVVPLKAASPKLVNSDVRFDRSVSLNALQAAWGDGQAPLVALLAAKEDWRFNFDAQAVDFVLSYPLVLVSRDLNVFPINLAKWNVAQSLVRAGPYLGLPRAVRSLNVRSGGNDPGDRNQWAGGSARWIAMLTFDVALKIRHEDVLAGVYPAAI